MNEVREGQRVRITSQDEDYGKTGVVHRILMRDDVIFSGTTVMVLLDQPDEGLMMSGLICNADVLEPVGVSE